jgi:hypothetical protein
MMFVKPLRSAYLLRTEKSLHMMPLQQFALNKIEPRLTQHRNDRVHVLPSLGNQITCCWHLARPGRNCRRELVGN